MAAQTTSAIVGKEKPVLSYHAAQACGGGWLYQGDAAGCWQVMSTPSE